MGEMARQSVVRERMGVFIGEFAAVIAHQPKW